MRISLLFCVLLWLTPAFAESVAASPQQRVQSVIFGQITAFLSRDAEAAWQYAHPTIKAQFKTPQNFLRMVALGYTPLLNFTELNFQELEQIEGQWLQTLLLRDEEGNWFELFYSLVEADDGELLITGVYLQSVDSI